MLYIISGASRSGKTILAKRLQKDLQISCLSIDMIMMAFMKGLPSYGVHDKLWPDEIAKKIWPFLEAFIHQLLYHKEDYILEGEAFLPRDVKGLITAYPHQVRAIFLGYGPDLFEDKCQAIRVHAGEEDWLVPLGQEEIESHVRNMIAYSQKLARACQEESLAYVSMTKDFTQSLESAFTALTT